MNTLLFVYALEIAKVGSITMAANNLFMTQPTLSKAVKELENELGFPVFHRTYKGVIPTAKGEEFLVFARKIVNQLDKMEAALRNRGNSDSLFSLVIPHDSVICSAATGFIRNLEPERRMDADLLEAGPLRAIDAVSDGHAVIGVIRCVVDDMPFYLRKLSEKNLQHEVLTQAEFVALMPQAHPQAGKKRLSVSDLLPYPELIYGDNRPANIGLRPEDAHTSRHILIYDRGTGLQMLQSDPSAYLWQAPVSGHYLDTFDLTQRVCEGAREYTELLISRSGYRYSKLDCDFLDALALQRKNIVL